MLQPADVPAAVFEVLSDGQAQGLIGAGPLAPHVRHALGFLVAVRLAGLPDAASLTRVADLGSGAGIPGLVLASVLPDVPFTLIEGSARRAAFLRSGAARIGLLDRVTVLGERAEVIGHDPSFRGHYSMVVARAFGAPGATAECGAPLLAAGGCLVVSEPPEVRSEVRWPSAGLAALGLHLEGSMAGYAVLSAERLCSPRYPRRVGIPRKRPLF